MFSQRELAPEVAAIHAADLRHRDVGFIGKDNGVVGDELEQRRRWLARGAAGQIAGVVLDPVANPSRFKHFQVKVRALLKPLRLQELAFLGQLFQPSVKFGFYPLDCLLQSRARGHVVAVGIDADLFEAVGLGAGQRVEFGDGLQLVAKEIKAPCAVFQVGGPNLDHIATHAEPTALEGGVETAVLLGHQLVDEAALFILLTDDHVLRHGRIGLDRADAVDAGNRGHDDHIVALQQRPRGRVAHAVDGLVDLRFLLDIGVRAGDIGFGLVVIIIADKIFDGIVREETLEFAV